MNFCTNCGARLGEGARFCSECGCAAATRGAETVPPAGGEVPPQYADTPPSFAPPGPQGYPPPVASTYPAERTNGLAIASLVLGIIWLYWVGSVLALIFGYIGKSQIDSSNGLQGGRGLAIAGIVLGWVGIGVLIALLIVGVSLA